MIKDILFYSFIIYSIIACIWMIIVYFVIKNKWNNCGEVIEHAFEEGLKWPVTMYNTFIK